MVYHLTIIMLAVSLNVRKNETNNYQHNSIFVLAIINTQNLELKS